MEDRKYKIKIALICAVFGTIGVVTHFIKLSSATIVFYRALIGGIFIVFYTYLSGKSINIKSMIDNFAILVATGFFMGLNWVLQFEAFRVSSVALGTVCYNTMPIFLIIFASFIFKEKITIKSAVCILIATFGVVLISNIFYTGIYTNEVLGCIYGLLGAIFYALIVIYNRHLSDIELQDKIIFQFAFSAIIMAVYLIFITKDRFTFEKNLPTGEVIVGVFCILLLGLFHTGYCYVHYFDAVTKVKAKTVGILTYIDPLVALFLSFFVLKESMNMTQLIGAILILASTLANELIEEEK